MSGPGNVDFVSLNCFSQQVRGSVELRLFGPLEVLGFEGHDSLASFGSLDGNA